MEKIKTKNKDYFYNLNNLLETHYKKINFQLKETPNKSINNNKFISNEIYNDIQKHTKTYIIKLPHLTIYLFVKNITNKIINDLQKMINRFYCLIKCFNINNNFTFTYIPTKFKKRFPNNFKILSQNEINSGMSNVDFNKIYIFREEESLKVFIHELFHCIDFDRFLFNTKCNTNMTIHTEHKCHEAYNELGTMIYDCCFRSIENKKINLIDLIEKNRLFTIYQIKQILQYYNFKSFDINKEFKEKTSVYSYFILKGIYLYNLNNLLNIKSNYLFNIDKDKFMLFHNHSINNKNFNNYINKLLKTYTYKKNSSLKMTI